VILRWWILTVFGVFATTVAASDQQRELDYATSIERSLVLGRLVWLEADQQRFLGLLTESEKTRNTHAAIVLHDQGDHPDKLAIVHGLRTELPKHNWATLAIQLPLREVGAGTVEYYALFDEAKARILAAIKFLRDNGAKDIALIGYGTGAAMASYMLSTKPDALLALVAISLSMPDSQLPQANTGDFMRKIGLPVLDIYAEFDLPDVVDTARQRRMSAKDNPGYRQSKINGEDHNYQQDPALLIKQVYSWLAFNLIH